MKFIQQLFSEENIIIMITTMIPILFISIISPISIIKIALKQFYTQKWWGVQVSAYFKIVKSLSTMIYVQEQRFEHDVVNSINLDKDTIDRYRDIASKSYHKLWNSKGIGAT